VAREREIYRDQARASGKPDNIVDKIADGKLDAFFKGSCLYEQPFVKEPSISVGDLIQNLAIKIRENLQVRRFVRFQTGEGIEKRVSDLASEVREQLNG
jgi:elongation factor Ts